MYFMCMFVSTHAVYLEYVHAPWHRQGGQKTLCGNWFYSSAIWVLGIQLKLSGLVADRVIC